MSFTFLVKPGFHTICNGRRRSVLSRSATVHDRWVVADTTQVFPYFVGDRWSSNPTSLLKYVWFGMSDKNLSSHWAVTDTWFKRNNDYSRPSQTRVLIKKSFFVAVVVVVGKVESSSTLPIIQIVFCRPLQIIWKPGLKSPIYHKKGISSNASLIFSKIVWFTRFYNIQNLCVCNSI